MKIRGDAQIIEDRITDVCVEIEKIIEDYTDDYAEYGWDNFTETLANVSAQLYMMRVMIHNARITKDSYR